MSRARDKEIITNSANDVCLAPVTDEQKNLALWYKKYPDKRILFCDGIVGNSKTTTLVVGFFLWAMTNFENKEFGILGKDKDTVERNVFYTEMWIYLYNLFSEFPGIRGGPHNEEFYIGSNKFIKYSGNNKLGVGSIQGANLAGLYVDDATQVDEECFHEAMQRCRVPGYRIWISCNPTVPTHYLYKRFIAQAPENTIRIRLSNKANPFLPPDYYENLLQILPPIVARRKVYGEWCADEGLIYSNFDPELHVKNFRPPQGSNIESVYRVGIDIGYNHGTAFIFGTLYYLKNKPQEYYLYIWHEYFFRPDEDKGEIAKSPEQILDDLYEQLEYTGFPVKDTKAFCDTGAKHFILSASKYKSYGGAQLKVYKAVTRVLDKREISGISLLRDLFQSGRIGISPRCTHLIDQLQTYRWAAGQVDTPFKKERSPEEDLAAVDALRYLTNSLIQHFYKIKTAEGDARVVEDKYSKVIYGTRRTEDSDYR